MDDIRLVSKTQRRFPVHPAGARGSSWSGGTSACWWILIAWFLNLTIIGLPLGLWMLNRVPLVLTLRTTARLQCCDDATGDEVVVALCRACPQHSFVVRALYFVLIGWWFSLIWSVLAWLLCVTIIGLPLGVWMFNRLPRSDDVDAAIVARFSQTGGTAW